MPSLNLVQTTDNLPEKTMSLKDYNYDLTETECPDCEEGMLWVNSFELLCDECSVVTRTLNRDQVIPEDPIETFEEKRDTFRYKHSDRVKMQGGFFDRQRDIEPGDNGIYGMGHNTNSLNNTRRRR